MEHRQNGQASLVPKPADRGQQRDLVGEVEVQRRLIEEEQVRLLGEGHRHEQPLSLPSGELLGKAIGQVERIRVGERADHRLLIGLGRGEEAPSVRSAAHLDQLRHAEAGGQVQLLGQHRDAACEVEAPPIPDATAVERDLAGIRPEDPGEETKQRRLAAAIGAHQRDEVPARQSQVD